MASNGGTVQVDFVASTQAFTRELQRVESGLRGVESNLKSMNRVADLALRALSGALLANFAKQALAAADATATAAERAGNCAIIPRSLHRRRRASFFEVTRQLHA